jgi:hypothetical protein
MIIVGLKGKRNWRMADDFVTIFGFGFRDEFEERREKRFTAQQGKLS